MSRFDEEINSQSPDFRLGVPLNVFMGEAVDVSALTIQYWSPKGEGKLAVPGLSEAGDRMYEGIGKEVVDLVNLAQQTHVEYLLIVNPRASKELLEEATWLRDRIESVLEYAFDDDVEDEKDAQLEAVQSNDSDTIDGLALDLEELVGLANEHLGLLKSIKLFDPAWLDRADACAKQLRELPPANVRSPEAKAKIGRRNQYLSAIARRVREIRLAAKLVFFQRPDLVRKFTSAYERRRRTALRRAKARKALEAQQITG